MNIVIIQTGGTIGSSVDDTGYIAKDNKAGLKLLEYFKRSYPELSESCSFSTVSPFTLLSENLNGKYLKELGECVKQVLSTAEALSGIIITHGSDTLQYSAAFLHYYLGKIQVPVLLVASNYVLDDKRANGLLNFAGAIRYIVNGNAPGVYVPYINPVCDAADETDMAGNCDDLYPEKQEIPIHRADLLLQHLPYSDCLYSMKESDAEAYAATSYDDTASEVDAPEVDASDNSRPDNLIPARIYSVIKKYIKSRPADFSGESSSGILRLTSYPGMSYPDIDLHSYKAIMLETYHSGTLCSNAEGMKEFVERANSLNIPIFILGCNLGADYESVKEWKDYGFNILPEISPIAAYMVLWLYL